MLKFKMLGALAGLALFGIVNSAQATPIEIGSFTFDENAFADAVGNTTGEFRTFRVNADGTFDINLLSVDLVFTDGDLNTGAFCQEPCTIELLFTDNAVVNGAGDDLILFEQGGAESTDVTITGMTFEIASFVTEDAIRDAQGRLINIYGIDLDDFGVAPGNTIISVLLDLNHDQSMMEFPSSDPLGLFALNSIPINIAPSVMLGDGSSVGANSNLRKDVIIGLDADIGEDVTLNKGVEAGDDLVVGDGTIVNKETVFGDEVTVGENVSIGRSCMIGDRVDIGDNTMIGQRCDIGSDVMIGSNVVMGHSVTISNFQIIANGSVIPPRTSIP